jgi:hypothetical protein
MDDADAFVVVGIADRAEHHGPDAVHADLDPGSAESAIAHSHALNPRI